jgi:hypothetical protein
MRKVMTEKELKMDVLTSGMTGDINNATLNRTYSQPETPKMTSDTTSLASGMNRTQRFGDYNSAT